MSPLKKGTKLTDNPKDTMIRVRVDNQTLKEIDECADALKSNRSEVIRKGVKELHQKHVEKK